MLGGKLPELHFGLKGLQLKLVLMFDVLLIVFFKHCWFKCYPQIFNDVWPRNLWRPLQNLSLFSTFIFLFTDGVCLVPEYDGMKCVKLYTFMPYGDHFSFHLIKYLHWHRFWPEVPKHLLTVIYKLINIVIPQLVLLFPISLLFCVLDSVSASNVSSSKLAVVPHRSWGCCMHRAGKLPTGPLKRERIDLEKTSMRV